MRSADVVGLALEALSGHKARTALTLLGVVIGTFLLAVNLSLGRGVQDEILRQLRRGQELRQVLVWPRSEAGAFDIPPEDLRVEGNMSEAKKARIRDAIIRHWQARGGPQRRTVVLTPDRLRALAELPHVESVVPPKQACRVRMSKHSRDVLCLPATADNAPFHDRIEAGSYLPSDGGHDAVVSEYLLYVWGYRSDDEVRSVLGRPLRVECRPGSAGPAALLALLGAGDLEMTPEDSRAVEKALKQLPAVVDKLGLTAQDLSALHRLFGRLSPGARSHADEPPAVGEFIITGVYRELTAEEMKTSTPLGWGVNTLSRNADVWLPVKTGEELFLRAAEHGDGGLPAVIVTVDAVDHVKEVTRGIRALDLEEFAPENVLEQVEENMVLTTVLAGLLAAAALLVAVLGITNTMIMSVLERTREIGVMKALGARDAHIQLLFLAEGALLGAVGGVGGVVVAWLASFPGESVARSLVKQSSDLAVAGPLFVFPAWLLVGLPVLAVLVTTLAAVYPARRAARVDPITALRHE
jgi:putative ABC transport system permease protein